MQLLKKKRKNKDQKKSKVIMSCMMTKPMKSILREKKKKEKWSEEQPRLSSPKKVSKNKSHFKILRLKSFLVEELLVQYFSLKEKKPKNSLP